MNMVNMMEVSYQLPFKPPETIIKSKDSLINVHWLVTLDDLSTCNSRWVITQNIKKIDVLIDNFSLAPERRNETLGIYGRI